MSLENIVDSNSTLSEILFSKDNEYSFLEQEYVRKYNTELLSKESISTTNTFFRKVSIIIPAYNSADTVLGTLITINNQILSGPERELIEVIVVDDGSTDDTEERIKKQNYDFSFKYIKQANAGRSFARNIGVKNASGETLIFLDSDVLLEKSFIREHAVRCEALRQCVFISFKENVYLDQNKIFDFIGENNKPEIEKDFRFLKAVSPSWKRIHRFDVPIETRVVKVVEESNNLKDLGKGRVLGVWDLPSIALTCSISMRKEEFLKVGGFNTGFKGWGMEDTFLAACLIANNNYLVPVFSTGVFHIKHDFRSGSEENQLKEFNKNVELYNELLKKKAKEIMTSQQRCFYSVQSTF